MNLISKQKLFARLIAKFILEAYDKGYEITLGEAWRPAETAALYAKEGKGISNSLHTSRLAVDLNAFRGGVLLTRTEQYGELGLIWEGYSTGEYQCAWGGHFKDGNHFSIAHQGVR